jgi:hypothetical protein
MKTKFLITVLALTGLQALQAATPTTFDVTLTVTQFRTVTQDPLTSSGGGGLTDHTIAIANENPNLCFLHTGTYARGTEKTTIRVQKDRNAQTHPNVVFQFKVTSSDGESYAPIGIAFARADKTSPAAVRCEMSSASAADTPFSGLNITNDVLTVVNSPLRKGNSNVSTDTHTTYKFSVVIQRKKDGAIGILDPEIENENLP